MFAGAGAHQQADRQERYAMDTELAFAGIPWSIMI